MSVHICQPRAVVFRKVLTCGTCRRRRRFVVEAFAWYPTRFTCCACGDAWSEEGREPRPFARGWRVEARRAAAAKWDSAIPAREVRAAFDALMTDQLPEVTG